MGINVFYIFIKHVIHFNQFFMKLNFNMMLNAILNSYLLSISVQLWTVEC